MALGEDGPQFGREPAGVRVLDFRGVPGGPAVRRGVPPGLEEVGEFRPLQVGKFVPSRHGRVKRGAAGNGFHVPLYTLGGPSDRA